MPTPFIIHNRGFTLIELLLYFALCSLMLGVLGMIGINVLESRVKAHQQEEVRYHGAYVIETLRRYIDLSDSVIEPHPSATSSRLVLAMPDILANPTTFFVEDGIVMIEEGGQTAVPLSFEELVVSDVLFFNAMGDEGTESVGISITAEDSSHSPLTAVQATFKTTVTKRVEP